jgi:hypothetical protein
MDDHVSYCFCAPSPFCGSPIRISKKENGKESSHKKNIPSGMTLSHSAASSRLNSVSLERVDNKE